MTFQPITVGSSTYAETSPGKYVNTTASFGEVADYIKISPGKLASDGATYATITYGRTFVNANAAANLFDLMTIKTEIRMPPGASQADADAGLDVLNTFLSPDTINSILLGKS